jgi:hypothetical protein
MARNVDFDKIYQKKKLGLLIPMRAISYLKAIVVLSEPFQKVHFSDTEVEALEPCAKDPSEKLLTIYQNHIDCEIKPNPTVS